MLDPEKIDHKNPRFGENEVKVYVAPFVSKSNKLILRTLNLSQVEEEAFLTN